MRAAFALRMISGKNIYNFAFVALCGALQTPFHGRGVTESSICSAAFCENAPLRETNPLRGSFLHLPVSTDKAPSPRELAKPSGID